MKTKLLILICMLLMVVSGCKTVKKTVELQSDYETTQKNDVVEKTDSITKVKVVDVLEDKSVLNDSLVVNEVTVVLSKPDSIGKQYPESITYKETTKVNNVKKDLTQHSDSLITTNKNQLITDKTEYTSGTSVTIDAKSKVKRPSFFTWLLLLLGIGVLIFAFFILRRFGVFKPPNKVDER